MNTTPTTSRPAFIIEANGTISTARIDLTPDGKAPAGIPARNMSLATDADHPLPIYRANDLQQAGYVALAEVFAIVDGYRQHDAARAAEHTEALERMSTDRSGAIMRAAAAETRAERIRAEARRWKARALAAETEADTLHAALTSAETRARIATSDRDLLELKLDVAITNERQATNERNEANARAVEAQANALNVIERVTRLIPEPIISAAIDPAFELSTYYGTDNAPVVQIDSQQVAGRVRVNLNDGVIYDGDPEHDERPGRHALPLKHERERTEAAATISRQLDTIREQAAQIEQLQANNEQTARIAESRQAELIDTRASIQAHADAAHNESKHIWELVRSAAGIEAPAPILSRLRDLRTRADNNTHGSAEREAVYFEIVGHPVLKPAYDGTDTLRDGIMRRLTQLAEIEQTHNEQQAATE